MNNWLEETYREHAQSLFRLAWLILRDVAAAEDAVHAAFLTMLTVTQKPLNQKGFAMRAVRNAAIDERRRRLRKSSKFLDESQHCKVFPNASSALEVEELLQSLTHAQQEVVQYHLRLQMSFREIAELLAEPISTVSSRYQRAIEQLRKQAEVHNERT